MAEKNPQSELTRLRNQQLETRENEVFGGLSQAERAEYDTRTKRIHELDTQLQADASE